MLPLSMYHSGSFDDKFSAQDVTLLRSRIDLLKKVSYVPVVGQVAAWFHNFYVEEWLIPNHQSIYCKLYLRKTSLEVLQNCIDTSVIHSIALTVIFGLATYLDTGSSMQAYLTMGYKISAFYALMTLPSHIMHYLSRSKLQTESALKKEYEKLGSSDDVIPECEEDDDESDVEETQTSS